jgi:hypothetical protein
MIYTDLKTMKKKFYSPVKEEYYGRTKYIQNMYENCCEICDKLNSLSSLESLRFNTNFYKANISLQQNMCKEFGFKKSIVGWDAANINLSCSLLGGMFTEKHIGLKDSVYLKKKNDKYYDSEHEFTILIYFSNGDIRNCKLNGEELMGILLHEIGHNFERRKYIIANFYLYCVFSSFGTYEVLQYIHRKGLTEFLIEMGRQYPNIDFFCNLLYQLYVEFRHTINFFSGGLVDFILHFTYYVLTGKAIFAPLMLKTEQFADSFAAKYGFGPGLISGLQKVEALENDNSITVSTINSIPILRSIFDVMHGPTKLCHELFCDTHPVEEIRYESIKTDLMNDYNDPEVPKEFKPIIKQQIIQCEKLQEFEKTDAEEKQKIFTLFKKYLMNDIFPTKKWVDFYYH